MARQRAPGTARFTATALILAVLIAAVLYGIGWFTGKSGPDGAGSGGSAALSAYADGAVANFVAAPEPMELKPVSFNDADGNALTLADFEGKVILLNLWATWCVPCREEMPALARLQTKLGSPDFEVVAVSVDRGGDEIPAAFLEEVGATALALYHDPQGRAGVPLGAFGLPTTLLIGPDGRSLGRLVGPAEWDAPEAEALIRAAIAQATGGGAAS